MRNFFRYLACAALLSFGLKGAMAQGTPQPKPLRLGLGIFGSSYAGDLTANSSSFQRFYPGANFSLQFASSKLLSPQLMAGFGKFISQDRDIMGMDGITPNKFVETPFFFVQFRLKARFLREAPVNPYMSAGLGLLGFNPRDEEGNNLIDNFTTRYPDETYGSIAFGAPLSLGAEVRLSPILHLGLEYTYNPTFTDYLDNISRLGTDSGKDRLHLIAVMMFLTFDPDNPITLNGLRGKGRE